MVGKVTQYFWNEYVTKGSWYIHGDAPGPLEFSITAQDCRKFPELKGYRTFRLHRSPEGRLRGWRLKAGFDTRSHLKLYRKYKNPAKEIQP